MNDTEKFLGFKKALIEENEAAYGAETRGKYGEEAVLESNQRIMGMTREQYEEITSLNETLMHKLGEAMAKGDPSGPLAQEAAELHKRWLCHYWTEYSKQAHAAMAQRYVCDERFTAYYDKDVPGTAKFLRDAILIYTGLGEAHA